MNEKLFFYYFGGAYILLALLWGWWGYRLSKRRRRVRVQRATDYVVKWNGPCGFVGPDIKCQSIEEARLRLLKLSAEQPTWARGNIYWIEVTRYVQL